MRAAALVLAVAVAGPAFFASTPAFAAEPPPSPPGAVVRPARFTGTIGAVSLPRLLSLELLARFVRGADPRWDRFAVGAGVEYLPPGLAKFGEETTLSWFQAGADGRYFLWRWLFLGGRVGYQFSRADSRKFGSEVDYETRSIFFSPKVGALYTYASGLTVAADLGATIPLFPETTLDSDGTQDSNARKVSKTFGMFVMPFLSVRVGWTI
jgi:hypothetical protein